MAGHAEKPVLTPLPPDLGRRWRDRYPEVGSGPVPTTPSETWNGADQNLLNLLLAMAEVSFAVEKFGADESSYRGIAAHRFVPVHELEDGGLPIPDTYR